jgi:2-oxoisovalerate dehydrogenase E1 component alpha subunit
MVLLREWDERSLKLQRSGRIGFCVASWGEEACVLGTAAALDDKDWVFAAYRQIGAAFWRGATLASAAHQLFGTGQDVGLGRMMPCHYSYADQHFYSYSSVIGTQIVHAAGGAMALQAQHKGLATPAKPYPQVAVAYFGDGASSAADFHSGLNLAGVRQSPALFFCINNQYAISLPVHQQTASTTLAQKAVAYGMHGVRVDGNDVLAVYQATVAARQRALQGGGPTLLELYTYRVMPHSSSDDPKRYRNEAEAAEWEAKDPLKRFEEYLRYRGLLNDEQQAQVHTAVQAEVLQAMKEAEQAAPPPWESLAEHTYAQTPAPLQAQLNTILTHETGLNLAHAGAFPL